MIDTSVRVRPADAYHVTAIATLIGQYAEVGQLLPRSVQSISDDLGSWQVAIGDGHLVGCGSLLPYGPYLAEIRSLAVVPAYQHQGVGSGLLAALSEQAKRGGVHTLFALTRAVPFFERMGFNAASRATFPEKVWRDCRLCPLQDRCDELAVVLDLVADPESHVVQIGGHHV